MGCNASFPLFLAPLGPLAPDPRPCTTAASCFGLEVPGERLGRPPVLIPMLAWPGAGARGAEDQQRPGGSWHSYS